MDDFRFLASFVFWSAALLQLFDCKTKKGMNTSTVDDFRSSQMRGTLMLTAVN